MLYKAYWSDGGQIPYPRDEEIIDEVNLVEKFSEIKTMNLSDAKEKSLFEEIGEEVDRAFIDKVKEQSLDSELIKRQKDLKIVYTPLHGTGNMPVRRVLSEVGFENVHIVKEQETPDGNFPTVGYPNPEDPKAFKLAIELAESIGADLVVATDPDADRVGVAVKNNSEYVNLTGNNAAALIVDYILSTKKEKGILPDNATVISTIVSTDMAKTICKEYGVTYMEVLTGFKYIGEKIKEFESTGDHTFIFGFEESYGLLSGTHARDKDAVVATLLLCEVAAYYKDRGMTMYDGLQDLYKKYGFYLETSESITLKGIEGVENIKKIMETLRNEPPKEIDGKKVIEFRDYKNSVAFDADGGKDAITLPVSDVLYFVLDDESWVCARPSGTEPKIKIYFGVKGNSIDDAKSKLATVSSYMMAKVNDIL